MRALIVGAGGQLGRALIKAAPADVRFVALDRAALDVTDAEAIRRVVADAALDVLFNAAAYTAVDRAESDAQAAYRLNRDAPALLASAARSCGARFVHVSTDFVFDGRAGLPYRPEAPTGPLNVYGASKLAGEQAVRDRVADALIVRTGWVYAAHGANFVHTMLRLMAERDVVRVVADQVGTPTHAASLARALWALARLGASGTHHYSDAGVASWYDFAVAIAEEARALGLLAHPVHVEPIATADYPSAAQRPAYSVLDKASCYALLGGAAAHWRSELRLMLRERGDGAHDRP